VLAPANLAKFTVAKAQKLRIKDKIQFSYKERTTQYGLDGPGIESQWG
jgi:hypothetical protein